MGPLARMIAPVIGLTQEGLAARKASKEAAAQREAAAQSSQASSSRPPYQNNYQDAPPLYDSRSDGRVVSTDAKQGQSQYENGRPDLYYGGVEEEWELDEASHELTQGPTNTNEPELSEAEITDAFLRNHPPPAYMPSNNMGRLPCPVILPQRRPGDKKRGFVRAYAPVLENCGIDQATFLDFLKSFHAASKASPYFMVIFLGAGIVGFVPTLTTTIISSSIQLAVGAAMEVQSRTRSTSFLDRLNREFFQPRGLFCMIMAYKPDGDSTHERVDINQAISSSLDPKTGMKGQFSKLKATSGKTYGEMELPQAAPLVFPVLDDLADDDSEEAMNMKDKMKNKTKFMRGYMDKRAQAKFAYENPGSSLSTDPSSQFASIYSDPSHPANSGSFISMVTGGAVNPKGMRQERRDKVMSKIGQGKDVPTQQNAFGKRQPRGPIRKMMKKDVLYLTIVNMPTEGELEAARRAIAEAVAQS